jgi:hypothetical protein
MKQAWMQAPIFDTLTLWCPRRDTKTLFPLHPLKAFSCHGPRAGLFSNLHPRTLLPFRIANRPALEKAAQSRHPIPLTRKLRIAQFRGWPTMAGAQTCLISKEFVMGGLILARNGASWYGPSALVRSCPRLPLPLDNARRAGGLCS